MIIHSLTKILIEFDVARSKVKVRAGSWKTENVGILFQMIFLIHPIITKLGIKVSILKTKQELCRVLVCKANLKHRVFERHTIYSICFQNSIKKFNLIQANIVKWWLYFFEIHFISRVVTLCCLDKYWFIVYVIIGLFLRALSISLKDCFVDDMFIYILTMLHWIVYFTIACCFS